MQNRNNDWAEAKRLCRLNEEVIQMAKELGLAPRSLIKNIPGRNQRWKAPVKDWIRALHAKKFGERKRQFEKDSPVEIVSQEWDAMLESVPLRIQWREYDSLSELNEEETYFHQSHTPTVEEIEDQNIYLLRRQKIFRMAADYFARKAAEFPWVTRVALFGSVALPLKKEIPRFRDYRQNSIKVWHECKDVDVAVWATELSDLNALRKARAYAVRDLETDTDGIPGVAHHQIDVFLLDDKRDVYRGRLCIFNRCPNEKPECHVPRCGDSPFLQQHENFRFYQDAIRPDRMKILFERNPGTPRTVSDDVDVDSAPLDEEDDDIPF